MTRRAADTAALIVGLLVLWQLLHMVLGGLALSSPRSTLATAVDLLGSRRFWGDAGETGRATLYGIAIAWSLGLLIGFALGFHRPSGEVADPMLNALYSIPKITLYPVILLIFGLGLEAKVAFGALHGVFPVAIFTMNALRQVSPTLERTARALRMGPASTMAHILLPAALPEIMTGLKVGFAATILGTLVGELFASTRGLGTILIRSISNYDVEMIMAVTLLVFAATVLANAGLVWVERRFNPAKRLGLRS